MKHMCGLWYYMGQRVAWDPTVHRLHRFNGMLSSLKNYRQMAWEPLGTPVKTTEESRGIYRGKSREEKPTEYQAGTPGTPSDPLATRGISPEMSRGMPRWGPVASHDTPAGSRGMPREPPRDTTKQSIGRSSRNNLYPRSFP